jgi:hypothetical protein
VPSLPPLATVAQLETRLGLPTGTLADADLARAQADLADASELVRTVARVSWVDANGNADAPAAVVVVVLQCAMRAYNNPNGYMTETVSADGATYTYSSNPQAIGIYLTADEVMIVQLCARQALYGNGWHGTGSVLTSKPGVRGVVGGYVPWAWRA